MLTNMLGMEKVVWERAREEFSGDASGLMHFAAGYADAWMRRERSAGAAVPVSPKGPTPGDAAAAATTTTNTEDTQSDGARELGVTSGAAAAAAAAEVAAGFPLMIAVPSLTLYFDPVFRCLAVWTLLEACHIPYEQHLVNLMKDDVHQPPLRDINPFGRLPLLKVSSGRSGTKAITSRSIMLKYICAAFPRRTARFAPGVLGYCSSTVADADVSRQAAVEAALESLAEVETSTTLIVHEACDIRDQRSAEESSGLVPDNGRHSAAMLERVTTLLETFRRTYLPGDATFIADSQRPTIADLYLACDIMLPLQCAPASFASVPQFARDHFARVCRAVPEIDVLANGATNTVGFGLADYINLVRHKHGAVADGKAGGTSSNNSSTINTNSRPAAVNATSFTTSNGSGQRSGSGASPERMAAR